MELLQLRYFYESAQNGSFAKTAKNHMVPLTSVSASVKRLESELGFALFDRHSNKIELNENGKELQNTLFMIFDELDGFLNKTSGDKKEIKIFVRVLRSEITDHIINYTSMYPEVSFKTIFDFNAQNLDDFDIIIDDNTENYPLYKRFEYTSKRVCFRAAVTNPLCGKRLKLKELWNQKFITMGEHTSAHKMLVEACRHEGFVPNIAVQTNDLLCYNKYIEAGIGIALGRYEANLPAQSGSAFLDVTDFTGRQNIYVFYKKQAYHGNVRDFIDYIKEHSDKMSDEA